MENTQVQRIQIGEAFSYGWRRFMNNAGPWLLVTVLGVATGFIFAWLSGVITNSPGTLIFGLASFVATNAIAFVLILMAMDAVAGRDAAIPNVRDRINAVVTYLVATFLFGLGVAFGLVLLIVPGIIFAVAYYFYGFAIADAARDPITALKQSADLTRGRRWRLFEAGVVAFLVNLLGLMAFGVGILISYPITVIAGAHIYRQLRGEPIAE